jgi:hypothetical protein
VSLTLLRLLEVEYRHHGPAPKIIFITAVTHAAIEACRSKLLRLMDAYRSIDSLPSHWLDDVRVEVVSRGNDHTAPQNRGSLVQIYTGTIYQVHNITYLSKETRGITFCLAL